MRFSRVTTKMGKIKRSIIRIILLLFYFFVPTISTLNNAPRSGRPVEADDRRNKLQSDRAIPTNNNTTREIATRILNFSNSTVRDETTRCFIVTERKKKKRKKKKTKLLSEQQNRSTITLQSKTTIQRNLGVSSNCRADTDLFHR